MHQWTRCNMHQRIWKEKHCISEYGKRNTASANRKRNTADSANTKRETLQHQQIQKGKHWGISKYRRNTAGNIKRETLHHHI